MTIIKDEKHKQYARYATHCLDMLTITKDPKARTIQREMAAEWTRLADAAVPRRSSAGKCKCSERGASQPQPAPHQIPNGLVRRIGTTGLEGA